MRRRAACLTFVAAMAGCGSDRAAVPDPRVPAPAEGRQAVIRGELRAVVPASWQVSPASGDRLFIVSSGPAVIAVWRYKRAEPVPADAPSLRQARAALLDEVRERDPTFEADAARARRFKGRRAIELEGAQTLAGRRVRTRSLHVFAPRTNIELVVDAYAPPRHFARFEREVLEPMLASIELVDEP